MTKLRRRMPGEWTDAEIKTLTEMWDDGLAASAISKVMGKTRNAIIGKFHRLGLYRRTKELLKADGRAKTVKPKKPKTEKPAKRWAKPRPPAAWTPKPTEIVMPEVSKRVSLLHVREGQCRAIVDYTDKKLDQAICCGEPVTVGRLSRQPISWCAYHHSIYFEPPKESRDARGGTARRVAPNWSPRRNQQIQTNPQEIKKSA